MVITHLSDLLQSNDGMIAIQKGEKARSSNAITYQYFEEVIEEDADSDSSDDNQTERDGR